MILKCIGGPNDGQKINVPDNYKYGDTVRVQDYSKLKDVSAFNPSLPPQASDIAIDYNQYKITALNFLDTKNYFAFLIPYDWTNYKAIEFQFNK